MKLAASGGSNYIESGTTQPGNTVAPLLFTGMNTSPEFMRITAAGSVGIGITAPTTMFHVAGGAIFGNGYRPQYINVSTAGVLYPATSTYGTLYNITTSGLTSVSWPTVNMPGDANAYWILRNNTGVYLSISSSYSTVAGGTALPSPMTIPPGTSVNVMVVYVGSVLSYIMF
jgi:hypothetical protein